MKMSPIAQGASVVPNMDIGHSAGSDRMARAKAIAGGETPQAPQAPTPQDHQVNRVMQRIKMKTQVSPDRFIPETLSTLTPQSDILDTNEQTQAAPEVTQPLSPQFAALAKAKRALQVKEKEIQAREIALAQSSDTTSDRFTKEQIKANALRILRESGVSNDELTEAILREAQDYGPGYTHLEGEIQALKNALDTQNKSNEEREKQSERQVLGVMKQNIDRLVSTGDTYELTREAGYAPKVIELMYRTFKKTGEVLDERDACQFIEDELMSESLKFAAIKKVQSRLNPTPTEKPQAAKPGAIPTKTMRTLTQRDGASSVPGSRRERAIAAFYGRK
jgi:hypothetical protein